MNAYARYIAAAALVRTADGGAAAGLVLLAVGALGHEGARIAGLLAAGLTAPHLLGPWLARWLDGARDGRALLGAVFAAYGIALGAAALLLGRAPLPLVAAAVVAAGACGPLLTGGLSSRLADVAPCDGRAEGWDAATYGVGGTAGPAAVAALAALASPLAAVLALAGAAIAGAALTLTLPAADPRERPGEASTVRGALRAMATHGPLRRVSVVTMVAAFTFGAACSVVAVVLGEGLAPHGGAALVAAFGLGNLAGSLAVTAFPLRGEPEILTARHVAVMGAALALCAVAPTLPIALAAFALAGAANGPFFAATLAARSRYAPPRARAQVFVSMAGAKVAMAAAGTAVAGFVMGAGPRPLLAAGAALTVAAAGAVTLDRRLTGAVGGAARGPGPRRR